MNTFFRHLFFVCILGCSMTAFCQQTIEVILYDTITLDLGDQASVIQWQVLNQVNQFENLIGETSPKLQAIVTNIPMEFRAKLTPEDCDGYYSGVIRIDHPGLRWSNPATWESGEIPKDGDVVTIPEGKRIILDIDSKKLAGLQINGTLEFAEKDLALTTDWIIVHGILRIGSETDPFKHKAVVTLTGSDRTQSIMGMGTRGIMVMGGKLELHGYTPEVLWTKINTDGNVGAIKLGLLQTVEWKVGDRLVIAPTDFYRAGNGVSITETFNLSQVKNKEITFDKGLQAYHWGVLQYPTAEGMSLESTNGILPPLPNTDTTSTPLVLDERAEIGTMTRAIVVQGPDDEVWKKYGFGVHVMIMPGSQAHVEGVEFIRSGQSGRLRRYAFHWHMLSSSGSEILGDAVGQYFRNSSITNSKNRGVVIHGTSGVTVSNNILYDIEGHGIFTEDAVERRNLIDHNLVLHIRNAQNPLKQHETGELGPSGFWISNPDNVVTNNVSADCSGVGFWLPFPIHPWGDNQTISLNPSRTLFGTFDRNTAHSNEMQGVMLDNVEVDNDGNTYPYQYYSTTDGLNPQWPSPNLRRFSLSRLQVWKNGSNGIWDRSTWPDNYEIVSADNCGRFFAGSGANGIIERCLVVGTSLNHLKNGTDRPSEADFAAGYASSTPVAFATYHSSFNIKDNIVVNFQSEADTRSGVFSTDDYYIRPVEKGQLRNSNNLIINSHPGVKLPAVYPYFTLASALWDPYGIWGPEGNYIVYDDPFLTHGKDKTLIAPGTDISGGVSVQGPFYGFEGFVLHGVGDAPPKNQPYFDLMGIYVRRLNQSLGEVASWSVPEAQADYLLNHMRDFATSPDGIYELTFPQESAHPTNFQVNVENMLTTEDIQVLGVQFDGFLNPVVGMSSYGQWYPYNQVNSLQEVRNSVGETWWQDKANNRVWVKIQGGRWKFWTTNTNEAVPSSDELLYETTELRIIGN